MSITNQNLTDNLPPETINFMYKMVEGKQSKILQYFLRFIYKRYSLSNKSSERKTDGNITCYVEPF